MKNLDLNFDNPIIDTDSYKSSMWLQYPPKSEYVFQYLESRGCERKWKSSVYFGLQYYILRYLTKRVTMEDVAEAEEFFTIHGVPFNTDGWTRLVYKHDGRLPLRIRAVPEGTIVPIHNVLMTTENTDPEFFWLPTWFETMLVRLWNPITVATQSFHIRKTVEKYMKETSDTPLNIDYKVHDFGSRGVSSKETAMIAGAAHLTSFYGTDTCVAPYMLRKIYDEHMAGNSVSASEHSTITSWGKEHEIDAYRNMLKQFAKPNSIVACVSDSWDIYNACESLWGDKLKQEVIDSGATLVIRPDSGDPVEVIKKIISILGDKFGTQTNRKGYKVLNYVKMIQGDGVNEDTIESILEAVKTLGFSADNINFGSGGALLQKLDRDTMKFGYKCSYIQVNGEGRDVYKQPVTDKVKHSKRGRLDLILNEEKNRFKTVRLEDGQSAHPKSVLQTVFYNGNHYNKTTFKQIRERVSASGFSPSVAVA